MNIKSFIKVLQSVGYKDKIYIYDDKMDEVIYGSYIATPIPDSYENIEILYTWVSVDAIFIVINLN